MRAHTLEEANAYLEKIYLPMWNQRFVCEPRQIGDAHRALDAKTDLDSVLSRVEPRTLAQDYTVRWQAAAYQIRRQDIGGRMRGARVAIEQRLDGSMWMRWQKRRIPLQRCLPPSPENYHVAPLTLPAPAKAKLSAEERAQRHIEAQRRSAAIFESLPSRPLWQILRDPSS